MAKKEKKFKVVVCGHREEKVLNYAEPIEYSLPAANREEALVLAKDHYKKEYPDLVEVDAEIAKKQSKVSIICLSLAIFLSFIPWHSPGGSVIYLRPTLLPMFFSIAMYSAVIIRIKGLRNSFNSGAIAFGNFLTVIFIATFVSLLTGDANLQLFRWTFPISGEPILLVAVLLSWLGIAKIAKFVWIAVFIIAIFRLLALDTAMGSWGMFYAIFGFVGIIFQLKQEDDRFLRKLGSDLKGGLSKARTVVKM